jgi:hypothetical protein
VKTRVTVLLPKLDGWVQQLHGSERYPSLETVLAKSSFRSFPSTGLDQRRFDLFGLSYDKENPLPIAAVCHISNEKPGQGHDPYFLRVDPVSLHADMSSLRLLRSGFADLPADYRQLVSKTIQSVFEAEGMLLEVAAECWTISLDEDPGVTFMSLDDSLGADISECLPDHPAARKWKRLMNEVQMALHALPLNEQRRAQGKATINSIWIWGGGRLPERSRSRSFDLVYTADPVSRGLARLQGSDTRSLGELPANGDFAREASGSGTPQSILVDWAVARNGAPGTAEKPSLPVDDLWLSPNTLDAFCKGVIARTRQNKAEMWLCTPGQSWQLRALDLLRFWKRRRPLASQLANTLKPC